MASVLIALLRSLIVKIGRGRDQIYEMIGGLIGLPTINQQRATLNTLPKCQNSFRLAVSSDVRAGMNLAAAIGWM